MSDKIPPDFHPELAEGAPRRDRYESLDRLERHTDEAIARLDDKISRLRASGQKVSMKLLARRANLLRTLDYEAAKIRMHIRNFENPPVHRTKPRKMKNGRRTETW